jgi:hypothetical protein
MRIRCFAVVIALVGFGCTELDDDPTSQTQSAVTGAFNVAVVIHERVEEGFIPLAGANVTLDGYGTQVSDGNGFVNFGIVAPGTYGFHIVKPGAIAHHVYDFAVRANTGHALSYVVKGKDAPTDWMEMFATESECERHHPEYECGTTQVRGKVEFFRARKIGATPHAPGPAEARSAEIVRVEMPDEMVTGRRYRIGLEVRNTGATAWTPGTSYRLGDWIGAVTGNHVWGVGRADLRPGSEIRRGEVTRFELEVTAPATPGTYGFAWRMLQESVAWFGQLMPTRNVVVRASSRIIGHVDGVIREGGATVLVGWACASFWAGSIDVHVYSGGAAGAGWFVTSARADRTLDPNVSAACATSLVPHRFRIQLDAALATHGGRALYVHGISPHGYANDLVAGSGVHAAPVRTSSPRFGSSGEMPDFDGDGFADFADHHLASGNFWVHRNQHDGTFGAGSAGFGVTAGGEPWRVLVADFTGDGYADYADLHTPSGQIWVHENLRNGTYSTGVWAFATTTAGSTTEVVPGDFDGDGRADLLEHDVWTGALRVRRNGGPGVNQMPLMPAATFASATGSEWRLVVGDFTGDGRTDVADLHIPSAQLWIHQGIGAPSYDFHRSDWGYAAGTAGPLWKVIAGDFNADGRADLGDLHLPSGKFWIHANLGGGLFAAPGGADIAYAQTNRAASGWDLLGE